MMPVNEGRTGKVDTDKLLDTLRENRDKHAAKFAESMEGYRSTCVKALTEVLANAQAIADSGIGNVNLQPVRRLDKPSSYLTTYDEAILFFSYCNDTEVELTVEEFTKYVLDKWTWSRGFADSHTTYTS